MPVPILVSVLTAYLDPVPSGAEGEDQLALVQEECHEVLLLLLVRHVKDQTRRRLGPQRQREVGPRGNNVD